MTRLAVPAGVSIPTAQRRLSPGYSQPVIVADGAVSATTLRARATAVASATPHTKGAWTEIVAATTSEISVIYLALTALTNLNTTDTSALLDIGIGAAGSEVVVVPNLALGWQSLPVTPVGFAPQFVIPVRIPLGSRIAVRCQGAEASKNLPVQMVFGQLPNGRTAPVAVIDLGTSLAGSKGVTLATPAVNTKSAWTTIVAATPQPFDALAIGLQGGADTTQPSANGLVDIGYGSAGNEIVLAPDLPILVGSVESIMWAGIPAPLIPCRLPAGTRLAARWATTNVGSTIDAILYGIPA